MEGQVVISSCSFLEPKDAYVSYNLFFPSTTFYLFRKCKAPVNSAQPALRGSTVSEQTTSFMDESPSSASQEVPRKTYGQQIRH